MKQIIILSAVMGTMIHPVLASETTTISFQGLGETSTAIDVKAKFPAIVSANQCKDNAPVLIEFGQSYECVTQELDSYVINGIRYHVQFKFGTNGLVRNINLTTDWGEFGHMNRVAKHSDEVNAIFSDVQAGLNTKLGTSTVDHPPCEAVAQTSVTAFGRDYSMCVQWQSNQQSKWDGSVDNVTLNIAADTKSGDGLMSIEYEFVDKSSAGRF